MVSVSPGKTISPGQQLMARRPSENMLHRPHKETSFDFSHALNMTKQSADAELAKFLENVSAALLRDRLMQVRGGQRRRELFVCFGFRT